MLIVLERFWYCTYKGLRGPRFCSSSHTISFSNSVIPVSPYLSPVLCGYPPRQLLSSNPHNTLHSLHINSGETLILEELSEEESKKKAFTKNSSQVLLARDFETERVIDLAKDLSLPDSGTNTLGINVQQKKAMNCLLKRRLYQ